MERSMRLAATTIAFGFAVPCGWAAEPETLRLLKTIPLRGSAGRLDHMAIDGRHARLFIANLSNNSLDIIDLETSKLVKRIADQKKIQGVAYAAELNRIFVGNGVDGVCNVFDGAECKLLKSIKLPDADNVRFDSEKNTIYVGHAEKQLSVIDARTLEMKATIELPGPPEAFQIDSKRNRVYVNSLNPATIAVIDSSKNTLIAKYPLKLADANYPMALDLKNQRIFVGCRKKPMVVVLDAATGKELAGIDIPGDIDDLFFDGKRQRLYATCGEGFLTVIQRKEGDGFEVIEKIAVPKLTRTCLFDSIGDRLYVPVPRQEGEDGPSVRIYRPKN